MVPITRRNSSRTLAISSGPSSAFHPECFGKHEVWLQWLPPNVVMLIERCQSVAEWGVSITETVPAVCCRSGPCMTQGRAYTDGVRVSKKRYFHATA